MSNLEIKDLSNISAGGALGAVDGGVVGFNVGLVAGIGAWKATGDENAVLGTAFSGAGLGFWGGAVAPTP